TAVSAGTGNAAASVHEISAGLGASKAASATSHGAQHPCSASGSGWVNTGSPTDHPSNPAPKAATTPPAATPGAIAGPPLSPHRPSHWQQRCTEVCASVRECPPKRLVNDRGSGCREWRPADFVHGGCNCVLPALVQVAVLGGE